MLLLAARQSVSAWLFLYIFPVLLRGYRKGRLDDEESLPRLRHQDTAASIVGDFRAAAAWRLGRGSNGQSPRSVIGALAAVYWGPFLLSGLLLSVSLCGQLGTPYAFHALLESLDSGGDAGSSTTTLATRYLLSAALFSCSIIQALTIHSFWYIASRIALHAQVVLSTQVLTKTLSLSESAGSHVSRGKLTNLMAIDASRLNDAYVLPFLHWNTWGAAVPVVVALFNLVQLLGWAGLAGVATAVVLVPSSTLLTRAIKRASERVQASRDARGKLVGEAVGGILTLKVYGWVDRFAARIEAARGEEVVAMRRKQLLGVVGDFIGSSMTLVISAVALLTWSALHPSGSLSASTAFSALQWIQQLNMPLRSTPYFLSSLVDSWISLRRLGELDALPDADVSGMDAWVRDLGAGAEGSGGECISSQPPLPQPPVPMTDWVQGPAEGPQQSRFSAADQAAIECHGAAFGWGECDPQTPDAGSKANDKLPLLKSSEDGSLLTTGGGDARILAAVRDVTFSCDRGSLTFVVGTIGSGKSSLLCGLVGAADRCGGTTRVRGSVAYCGQTPFIMNCSLRENIHRFRRREEAHTCGAAHAESDGSDETAAFYQEVLRATALDEDVARFPHGDKELIGDNGVTLSGGQKARVALARALLANSDVVILDDIISALDAHVAAHVWSAAINGLLLQRGKTVLLATHALHLLHHASSLEHQVVVLQKVPGGAGGRMVAAGSLEAVRHLLQSEEGSAATAAPPPANNSNNVDAEPTFTRLKDGNGVAVEIVQGVVTSTAFADSAGLEDAAVPVAQQINDGTEAIQRGYVNAGAVSAYVLAMGVLPLLLLLLLYLMTQATTLASTYWVLIWTSDTAQRNSARYYALGYVLIAAALSVISLARLWMLNSATVRASTALHNAAMRGILGAPMAFFHTNPAGRICNRLLSDVSAVDNTMRSSVSALAQQVFALVAVVFSIALVTPYVLLFVAALSALYWFLGTAYRISARDMKRLLSVAKSPLMANYIEIIRGATTIRAFGPEVVRATVARHLRICDHYSRCYYAMWSANEFISLALEVIGSFVLLACAVFVVLESSRSSMSASQAGLLLTYVLQLPGILMWLVRQFSALETDLVAVERLVEYGSLESEEGLQLPNSPRRMGANSPAASGTAADEERGHAALIHVVGDAPARIAAPSLTPAELHLVGVSLRYAPALPRALDSLSLALVPAGLKVAVLGRTGAGKSSLLQAVLRLSPIEAGDIIIGGLNTRELTCAAARCLVSAALQDSTLFGGTVRSNIVGPAAAPAPHPAQRQGRSLCFGRASSLAPPHPAADDGDDAEIWAALRASGADRFVGSLDTPVPEGGSCFSSGERALLSLARLLFRQQRLRCGLIVADESTANVDATTARVVHESLLARPETLLFICHRLDLVARFDAVAVLAGGRCAELGPPAVLGRDPHSLYSQLLAAGRIE